MSSVLFPPRGTGLRDARERVRAAYQEPPAAEQPPTPTTSGRPRWCWSLPPDFPQLSPLPVLAAPTIEAHDAVVNEPAQSTAPAPAVVAGIEAAITQFSAEMSTALNSFAAQISAALNEVTRTEGEREC